MDNLLLVDEQGHETEAPPNDRGAEQALLGCILLDPSGVLPEIGSRIKNQEIFWDFRHKEIYDAMVSLFEDSKPVDLISLNDLLTQRGKIVQVGGVAYLADLPNAAPSAHNATYYLDLIVEKYLRRRVLDLGRSLQKKALEGLNAQEMMDLCEKELTELAREATGEAETTIVELVRGAIDYFEACWQRGSELLGISTGIHDLNKKTNGLKEAEMFVLAGRPSTGKTSLAMNIAEHVACDLKLPVGVFSLEMTKDALVRRMICTRAHVNERHIMDKSLTAGDHKRITNAGTAISKAPLYIDDTPGLNILQVRSRARRMAQRYGIKLLVVDYLQLLQSVTGSLRHSNRQQEIADISNGLKSILKELRIPGVILAQLNREIDKDKNRKPRLSDLRESGAIEQDADIVGMLYNTEDYEPNPDIISVNCYIAKQRNGPTGDVELTFFKSFTKFEMRAPSYENKPTID